jgi:HrpA-like RNA helicase
MHILLLIFWLINDLNFKVFLPGYEEINECYNRVDELWQNKKVRTKPVIFTLHSQLNTGTQQRGLSSV